MADIPGLIEGAATGGGLGHKFLKHLSRTCILLHVIDVLPLTEQDPILSAKAIINELRIYDEQLLEKPRWLVINQIDKLPLDQELRQKYINTIIDGLQWQDKVFAISALTGEGTKELCYALMQLIDEMKNIPNELT